MLGPETRRKVRELRVPGLLDAIDMVGGDESYAALSFERKVKVLVDYSYQEAMNAKVEGLIKRAQFKGRRWGGRSADDPCNVSGWPWLWPAMPGGR